MSSSGNAVKGTAQEKARPDPAKIQARKMLRTLCNFILPLVRRTGEQTINAKKIHFGIEADEFVSELEIFISGMISHSRRRSQKIAIEATLEQDWLDYSEDTNWLWETSEPDNETTFGRVFNGQVNLQMPEHKNIIKRYSVRRPMALSSYYKGLQNALQSLRRYITRKMPICLLCFEPHNGKLKISLLDRAEIYNYLAPKLQADYNKRSIGFSDWNERNARYAILSHTWNQTPGELTYGDWQNGSIDDRQSKCQKLVNFCKIAWENHGLTLGWIDTVCINKESSAELDESIRSMYAWYRNAAVCITYLAGTSIISEMRKDPWFTRGWTFQELLASDHMKFYNKDWSQLSGSGSSGNDKEAPLILAEIELATTITRKELQDISAVPISRRMQLAAKRQVTREEDIAYCLMGIFDVSISTAYGEGAERAFFRLVEEIFRSTKGVLDIFNWAGDRENGSRQPPTSLFPSHPSNYRNRSSNEQLHQWHPTDPFTLTHLGLRTRILLMPAVPISESVLGHQPIGDYYAPISIAPFKDTHGLEVPKNYHLLDRRFSGPKGLHEAISFPYSKTVSLTFGTLNVEEHVEDHVTSIHIPKTCLAMLLESTVEVSFLGKVQKISQGYNRLYTEKPIVFDLKKAENNFNSDDQSKPYYKLEITELAKHGMALVTLHL